MLDIVWGICKGHYKYRLLTFPQNKKKKTNLKINHKHIFLKSLKS